MGSSHSPQRRERGRSGGAGGTAQPWQNLGPTTRTLSLSCSLSHRGTYRSPKHLLESFGRCALVNSVYVVKLPLFGRLVICNDLRQVYPSHDVTVRGVPWDFI